MRIYLFFSCFLYSSFLGCLTSAGLMTERSLKDRVHLLAAAHTHTHSEFSAGIRICSSSISKPVVHRSASNSCECQLLQRPACPIAHSISFLPLPPHTHTHTIPSICILVKWKVCFEPWSLEFMLLCIHTYIDALAH